MDTGCVWISVLCCHGCFSHKLTENQCSMFKATCMDKHRALCELLLCPPVPISEWMCPVRRSAWGRAWEYVCLGARPLLDGSETCPRNTSLLSSLGTSSSRPSLCWNAPHRGWKQVGPKKVCRAWAWSRRYPATREDTENPTDAGAQAKLLVKDGIWIWRHFYFIFKDKLSLVSRWTRKHGIN